MIVFELKFCLLPIFCSYQTRLLDIKVQMYFMFSTLGLIHQAVLPFWFALLPVFLVTIFVAPTEHCELYPV